MTGFRAIQTAEERLQALLELRDNIDAEIRRLRSQTKPPRKVRGPAPRRSRYDIPECGTETAYQRHRWFSEDQDDACKAAHREHNRQLYASQRRSA